MKSFDKRLHLGREEELLELLNGEYGAAMARIKDSMGQYPLHRILKDRVSRRSKGY